MRAYEFLFEGKEEKIWKDWGEKLYQKLLSDHSFPIHVANINNITDPVKESIRQEYNNSLAGADPSRNQDYHMWISRLYLKNNFNYEDIGIQVHDALVKYQRMKLSNQLPDVRYKDINFFKSLQDLVHILPESGSEVVNNKGKYKVLADDRTCFVAQILDVNAAIYFGQGTNPTWCVSYPIDDPRNKWNTYKDNGPIYVIIPKVDKNHVNEKYLWQFESNQVKDRENDDLSVKELESLVTRCPVVKKLFGQKLTKYNIEFGFLFYSIEELVKYNGMALSYVNDELKNNPEIVKLAVSNNGFALAYASDELRSNYDIVKIAVSKNGEALQYASKELKNNPEIVKLAVSNDGFALHYASKKLRNNPEIVKLAVSNDGFALHYANKELRSNYEIIKSAISNDGEALQYASEELRSNPEIVKLAVSNDGFALQYASEELRSNPEIVKLAVSNDGFALQYASEELRSNPEIIEIRNNPDGKLAQKYRQLGQSIVAKAKSELGIE